MKSLYLKCLLQGVEENNEIIVSLYSSLLSNKHGVLKKNKKLYNKGTH